LRRSYRQEKKREKIERKIAQRKTAEIAETVRKESERLRNVA
jgi:hypothetical protein